MERDRSTGTTETPGSTGFTVTRALAVALALLFLVTGGAKILGRAPFGIASAGMGEFPPWVRIGVGVIEVACAAALFVPAATTFAALALATLMLPATATQYVAGDALWVPPLVLALLLLVAWRHNAAAVRTSVGGFTGRPHPLLRDAFVSGAIGGTVIALWFLVIDVVAGRPFYTPSALGRALFSVFGPIAADEGTLTFVDYNRDDGIEPQVNGWDRKIDVNGDGKWQYKGDNVRFRFFGGRYKLVFTGASGIDISAVGSGRVTLAGAGPFFMDDYGSYSVDGSKFQPLTLATVNAQFGSP